jgi:hypothetical protein
VVQSDHLWRVFENNKEFLVKHVKINVPSYSGKPAAIGTSACEGYMMIDHQTSSSDY